MSTEIILRNYLEYNQNMVWDGHVCISVSKDKITKPEQGIAGFTESKELIGVFIRESEVFFLYNNVEYQIDISNFKSINSYIDNLSRHFIFENRNAIIYETVYKPYIDPGISIYDSDPEEFDFLLFLSNNILQSKESLKNYIIAMQKKFI